MWNKVSHCSCVEGACYIHVGSMWVKCKWICLAMDESRVNLCVEDSWAGLCSGTVDVWVSSANMVMLGVCKIGPHFGIALWNGRNYQTADITHTKNMWNMHAGVSYEWQNTRWSMQQLYWSVLVLMISLHVELATSSYLRNAQFSGNLFWVELMPVNNGNRFSAYHPEACMPSIKAFGLLQKTF